MTLDLDAHHRIHFVGIGGIGMSALARYLLARGFTVSGSDRAPGEQGATLRALGARVETGHDAANLERADLVVFSSAVGQDNPELLAARERGIAAVKRAELLAAIANAGTGVAVAGTHGKTTTSALIGHLLVEGGLDPTVLVGGISHNLESNARLGGDLTVVEADEYDGSFLHLRPALAVITNAEPDHLDYYGTAEAVRAAYRTFAEGVRETLIICADDPDLPEIAARSTARVVSYGLAAGVHRAEAVEMTGSVTRFVLDGVDYAMTLAGLHNVRNATAAILAARSLGVDEERIVTALASFRGVARRFEVKGEVDGVLVMDDYAHHPTEIAVNLQALRERFHRPVRLIFQPHTFSRTKAFLPEFAEAVQAADAIYLLDVYAAREHDTLGVSGRTLADLVVPRHPAATYTETVDATVEAVVRDATPGDVVITMGAGDVTAIGPMVLERLARR